MTERLRDWCHNLKHLENLRIPRCYRQRHVQPIDQQLHVFTDDSQLGFGAVAYLRLDYSDAEVEVAFIMAKTHVAQVRQRTIPQLELKGA